ncbi:uncharacterized protein LOC133188841 [Saccostrea echinata]|uniref:uncharacterized protein LOC133188841 n=1 Tax=Saccostrea echinata TaxID=191078 RepID=UPI002A7EDAB2|nr:uncharacterized protein LOC133188841 [Saccostrea echinata]
MASFRKVTAIILYIVLQFVFQSGAQLSLTALFSAKRSTDVDIWYTNILILLLVPEVVICLRDIWMSNVIADSRYREWPQLKIVFMGLIMSITDAMALTYLTSEAFPKLPPFLIPSILCVGISPIIPQERVSSDTKMDTCSGWTKRGVIPFIQTFLVIVLSTLCVFSNILSIKQASFFGLSLLEINLIRYIPLQKYIVGADTNQAQNARLLYRVLHMTVILLTTWIGYSYSTERENRFMSFNNISNENSSYFVYTVSVFVLLLQMESFIPTVTTRIAMLSILICFCGTLTVTILALYINVHKDDLGLFASISAFHVSHSVYHIGLYSVTCVSVLLFYFSSFYNIQEETESLNSKLTMTIYDNVFVCQNLLRKSLSKIANLRLFDESNIRIFLCTTMYQESAHEMSRLLRSLKNISNSKKIQKRNIHIESHIFLDNGASGRDVKEFGIQLLCLIEETFMMEERYGIMIHTPYGIKLSWTVPGEMPLFLHLKDNSLVKGKKRWSQVMYMRYIMSYRANFHKMYHKTIHPSGSNFNELSDFVNVSVGTSIYEQEKQTDKDILDVNVPTVTFETSSKTSSFSDLTTVTNLEELESRRKESEKESDAIEIDFPNDTKSEITLRVPRLHFKTKNRRSSFDHSFISLENLQDKNTINNLQYAYDTDLQNGDLPYNFSGAKFRSSSFNDIEFEYHKHQRKDQNKKHASTLEDEKYHDFILATDADMAFDDESVLNLLDTMEEDEKIGGVCGRTFPIGIHRHPVVWLQMFDYAKDFWMIKSAQNIIGSVMCCPGCFSLYRFEAIRDVIETFSEPTKSILDVFTKDNGEDRWMCTLMMKEGWNLRYSYHGKNTTFCPEETEEFMKQRRRWLLSDFANAAVVARNLPQLMRNSTAFTLLYTLYILQLFVVMVLYPGSTIMMLALGFELVTSCPLLANAALLSLACLLYCILQISSWDTHKKLIVSKILILLFGFLTVYVFIATSVLIVEDIREDIQFGKITHIENLVLVGVVVVYLYSSLLHPLELHLLSTGIVYLFYLPLLNILLPLYAVCNIVDQTWGTRDDQKASVPKILRLPKFKKRKKRTSMKFRSNSYESLSSSAIDLQDISEDETTFWQNLVSESIGVNINTGITQEERNTGLRSLRNKTLAGYLSLNLLWVALLTGFYAFLTKYFTDKLVYGIVVLCLLGISALVQLLGMTVYRLSDCFSRVARLIS